MFQSKKIALVILAVALMGMTAQASDEKGPGPGLCAKDVDTLCAGVEKGHGGVMKCLKENEAKLSPGCSDHVKEMKEAMKEVHEACHEDREKLCKDVKPGHGRIIKCMKDHQAELSAACKSEIEKKKELRKKR